MVSLPTFYALGGDNKEWFTWDETLYVLLPENVNKAAAEKKIAALSMHHNGKQYTEYGYKVSHSLESVAQLYLHSEAGASTALPAVPRNCTCWLPSASLSCCWPASIL